MKLGWVEKVLRQRRRWLWGTSLKPTLLLRGVHAAHLWWNNSILNANYDPWISSCSCCCGTCERLQGDD